MLVFVDFRVNPKEWSLTTDVGRVGEGDRGRSGGRGSR